ncbi:hypothetical protein OT109_04165 [Phycisphaeraceae bacterium D3-23]
MTPPTWSSAMATMTMRQWKEALGEHVALEQVPRELGLPSMQVIRAVNQGELRMHTFRASDGRVFRAVRVRDLLAYRERLAHPAPEVTMEGMKRAFAEMAEA